MSDKETRRAAAAVGYVLNIRNTTESGYLTVSGADLISSMRRSARPQPPTRWSRLRSLVLSILRGYTGKINTRP